MNIEELFAKSITRDLEGVIKIGDKDERHMEQELDEYVVTDELYKHFKTFFRVYEKSLSQPTKDIGVWISGFFGSGKSHLLKIFAYLLENIQVGNRHAIDFFTKGDKIDDKALLQSMVHVSAAADDTDVILFNVDSRNQQTSKKDNKELLRIFYNVFNEMRGYSPSMPYLADLEEMLDDEGKFDAFKDAFQAIKGKDWNIERERFLFNRDNICKALVQTGLYPEDEAKNIVHDLKDEDSLSIDDFRKKITAYCQKKGPNHRVVFLVDEIGQYIGSNGRLMLDLQTIAEDLSSLNGKVWIIVTSQQNIDEVIKVSGNDFSKIQGRFDTRLSLSSSNVDEVLKRRILKKTLAADEALTALYGENDSNLQNLLHFSSDTPFQRTYKDAQDFSETYPFVSYQFDLLQDTLTDIRKNSASGRSIASGERSMLAVFKDSAEAKKDEAVGILIPYDAFYDPIAKFVDHIHQQVIIKAGRNERLNAFDIRVLKALFLVKYVRHFKANIENIMTLLIDGIDTDRLQLKQDVIASLNRLVKEVLVQQNLDEYAFLTDQEQDINRNIQNTKVDSDEVTQYIAQEIFGGIMKGQSFKYSGRYSFRFDQCVDNRLVGGGARNNAISINVLTPYALTDGHLEYSEGTLEMQSMGEPNQLFVCLPKSAQFWEDIVKVLQIQKFSQKVQTTNPTVTGIVNVKNQEKEQLRQHIASGIREALSDADIYLAGQRKPIKSKSPLERILSGLRLLIESIYNKLGTMDGFEPTEDNIHQVLDEHAYGNLFTSLDKYTAAPQAEKEVENYLGLQQAQKKVVVLRDVMDHFARPPYGFDKRDTVYCLAVLYKKAKITLSLNQAGVIQGDADGAKVYTYLTQSSYLDKLIISQRVAVEKKLIKTAIAIRQDLFNHNTIGSEEDDIMEEIKGDFDDEYQFLDRAVLPNFKAVNTYHAFYPGKETAEALYGLLKDAMSYKSAQNFFQFMYKKQDEFADIIDDGYEDIHDFYDPENRSQLTIFNKACDCCLLYEKSQGAITDAAVRTLHQQIRKICTMDDPFGKIKDLKTLSSQFMQAYAAMLTKEIGNLTGKIAEAKDSVIQTFHSVDMEEHTAKALQQHIVDTFQKLQASLERAQEMSEISAIRNLYIQRKDGFIREIQQAADAYTEAMNRKREQEEAERKKKEQEGQGGKPQANTKDETPATKKTPKITAKKVEIKKMAALKPQGQTALETPEDVETFLNAIRKQLLKDIEDGKRIVITD